MFLKNLTLNHYRNYEHAELQIDPSVNIFIGSNAQGKTNLLEAIFVLAMSKSYRSHKDKELIQWNQSTAMLQATVEKKYGSTRIDLVIGQQGKKAKINGLEQRRLSDYVGTLNVVMFAPEDLEIVKGSPGVRRRFMDMEIGQVQPSYMFHLVQYQKVLMQRNNALRGISGKSASSAMMMDVWNEQLASHGVKIIKKRQNFIKKLQKLAETVHYGITNGSEKIKIDYMPSFPAQDVEDETVLFEHFMLKLSQVKEQEIKRGMTVIGPHRDDMQFFINDKEVYAFGSQGQQRTAALSLKLAEIELIREEAGEYPILLLDDVLSELDQHRQTQLIQTFENKVQTFITTTGVESVDWKRLGGAKMVNVQSGSLNLRVLD